MEEHLSQGSRTRKKASPGLPGFLFWPFFSLGKKAPGSGWKNTSPRGDRIRNKPSPGHPGLFGWSFFSLEKKALGSGWKNTSPRGNRIKSESSPGLPGFLFGLSFLWKRSPGQRVEEHLSQGEQNKKYTEPGPPGLFVWGTKKRPVTQARAGGSRSLFFAVDDLGQLLHKAVDVLELAVHRGEAHVGYLVHGLELLHGVGADALAGDLPV